MTKKRFDSLMLNYDYPVLRAPFFAPRTRAWLDVTVWSSSQLYSVDDMVLRTFRNDHAELIAVSAGHARAC